MIAVRLGRGRRIIRFAEFRRGLLRNDALDELRLARVDRVEIADFFPAPEGSFPGPLGALAVQLLESMRIHMSLCYICYPEFALTRFCLVTKLWRGL